MVHIRQRRLSAKSRLACLEEQIAKNKTESYFTNSTDNAVKNRLLTLFPMAGGRCVSRQFKIDSIQAGMKFSGLQLNDNSFLSIL